MTRNMMKKKWSRLKTILDNLQEPKDIRDIEKLFPKTLQSNKRTIYNHLEELKALGLIEYNESTRMYQKARVKKIVFQSKADYDIAVKHAKRLILSSERGDTQRYDQTSLYNVVDLLAFHDNKKHIDSELDECVFQHIKTGYNREIYQHLQKYRQLMDESGLTDPTYRDFPFVREGEEKNRIEIPEEKLQEIDALKGMLAGIIDRKIMNPVMEGQPLLGECDGCPHLKFSVKD